MLAAALVDPHIDFVIDGYASYSLIITGTGHDGAPTGVGNADVFMSTDGTHPTHLGARHWGQSHAKLLGPILI